MTDDWIGPDDYEIREHNAVRTSSDNDCTEDADYYVHKSDFACTEHRPRQPLEEDVE